MLGESSENMAMYFCCLKIVTIFTYKYTCCSPAIHTNELELDPKTILNKVYEFWTFKYLGKRKRYQQLSDRQRFWYWKLAWD